ncbi:MAG: ABC transporter ATP-binding protein [Kiritimatiellaeota bacterium]|nr:ABC transporter ATP-binding protein [Kiritimatiellota bacterium]
MKTHHRNYAFRPPRKEKEKRAGRFSLLVRFFRTYLLPYKWALTLCAVIVSLNACSVYLMAYYGRIVVDSILVVRPAGEASAAAPDRRRISARDRTPTAHRTTRNGLGRRIDEPTPLTLRPPGAGPRLAGVFAAYVFTIVLLNFMARVVQRRRIRIGQNVTARLREDMHEKVLKLTLGYHRLYSPGRLLSRIMSDVGVVQRQMMQTVLSVVSNSVMIVVGVTLILSIQWQMGLIAFTAIPLYVLLYHSAKGKVRAVTRELRHTNSCLYGLVSQKFEANKAVQAYARERHELLNFHRLAACFLRDAITQQRISAGLGRSAGIISSLTRGAIFLYGTHQILNGNLSLGQMMYAYNAAMSLFTPVLALSQLNVTVTRLLVILRRLVDILDEPVQIADAPDAVPFPAPLKQGISVRHIRFRYSPDADAILQDVTLTVPAGAWLCLMGASGAGKTTLLYQLARLYEPEAGQILYDGVPLRRIRMDSLRKRIAYVPQEPQIFAGTIRENITYGFPDAEPAQIMAAAKAAEIHDFILEMPVQYETLVDERGTSLSGGQRQRISLARALLTDPDVLLLDDCTSALDAETERRIQDTLARILVGKTAVIVSQRISMAMRCHRICVLSDGLVTEDGTHRELLTRGGFYARLYHQQTE